MAGLLGGGKGGGGMPQKSVLNMIPILGDFLPDPNQEFQKEQMENAAEAYGAYRPEAAQMAMNALSNESTAYQGANNMLAAMYGAGNSFNPAQMLQTPMGPSQLSVGQTNAAMGTVPQSGSGVLGVLSDLPGLAGAPGGTSGGLLGGSY